MTDDELLGWLIVVVILVIGAWIIRYVAIVAAVLIVIYVLYRVLQA